MGDHALFYNRATAKRFPMLAKVPQHELAAMFNVPMVEPEALKEEELQFSEPYNDAQYNFRPSTSGKLPFIPTNSSSAKRSIQTAITVPEGSPYQEEEFQERQERIRNKPHGMKYGCRTEATETVKRHYYLNSLDEPGQAELQRQMRLQIEENKQALKTSQQSRRRSPQRRY